MMTIDKQSTIELYEEITELTQEDIEFAKKNVSLYGYKNDLELYITVTNRLLKDLEVLEEYELCNEVKLILNKMMSSID